MSDLARKDEDELAENDHEPNINPTTASHNLLGSGRSAHVSPSSQPRNILSTCSTSPSALPPERFAAIQARNQIGSIVASQANQEITSGIPAKARQFARRARQDEIDAVKSFVSKKLGTVESNYALNVSGDDCFVLHYRRQRIAWTDGLFLALPPSIFLVEQHIRKILDSNPYILDDPHRCQKCSRGVPTPSYDNIPCMISLSLGPNTTMKCVVCVNMKKPCVLEGDSDNAESSRRRTEVVVEIDTVRPLAKKRRRRVDPNSDGYESEEEVEVEAGLYGTQASGQTLHNAFVPGPRRPAGDDHHAGFKVGETGDRPHEWQKTAITVVRRPTPAIRREIGGGSEDIDMVRHYLSIDSVVTDQRLSVLHS